MAFRDRSESRAAPRRKPRRSSSPGKGTGPLAPAPSGVFAQRKVARQDVVAGGRARAQRKVQRAEGGLPTTTLPVKRLPTIARPTHRQAAATVREQRQALRGTSIAARDSAARGNADAETRRQLHNLNAAQAKLVADHLVREGVKEARAHPEKYGFRGPDAPGLSAPTVQMTPQLTQIHHKIRNGDVRAAMALIGAMKQAGGRAPVQARERAEHGVGAGLEAVAGLKLSKGAGLLAAATGKAANDLGNRALRGTGAGSDENALKNAVEDVKHFPYDAVRSGAQTLQAGADLAKYLPHGPREVVGGLAGIPGIAVAGLADAQGGKGSAKKAGRSAGRWTTARWVRCWAGIRGWRSSARASIRCTRRRRCRARTRRLAGCWARRCAAPARLGGWLAGVSGCGRWATRAGRTLCSSRGRAGCGWTAPTRRTC
jgi:hypothetical protein